VTFRMNGRGLAQREDIYSWMTSSITCVTHFPTGRSLAVCAARDDTPLWLAVSLLPLQMN
jgi:hypothetical protein